MKAPLPPHGGLNGPPSCMVPESEAKEALRMAEGLRNIPISNGDLSTLKRIGDGGLSPLTGFMDRSTFNRVLQQETIQGDGRAYAWTIPMSLPVREEDA